MQIESEGADRRRRIFTAGLCAVMALVFAFALIVPGLRHFFELRTVNSKAVGAWAMGSVVGIGGMLLALRLLTGSRYGSPAEGDA